MRINRIFTIRNLRWVAAIYLVGASIGVITALLPNILRVQELETQSYQKYVASSFDKLHILNEDLSNRVENIEKGLKPLQDIHGIDPIRLNELLETINRIESISDNQTSSLFVKVTKLDQEISSISDKFESFRLALNPNELEEILTVARLGDKIELFDQRMNSVENKIETIRTDVDAKVQQNFEQIDAQVDRFIDLVKWTGLLLIPLILNAFRDILPTRKKMLDQT